MKIEQRLNSVRKPNTCATRHCRNHTNGRKFCGNCRHKKWREENPEKYSFYNLRNRAKQRGVPFDLSFDEFKLFCHKTEYIAGKNRSAEGMSVDRINDDPTRGYHGYRADNIQVMSLSDNVKKKYLSYDWQTKTAVVWGG
jgi:hypothetical protein